MVFGSKGAVGEDYQYPRIIAVAEVICYGVAHQPWVGRGVEGVGREDDAVATRPALLWRVAVAGGVLSGLSLEFWVDSVFGSIPRRRNVTPVERLNFDVALGAENVGVEVDVVEQVWDDGGQVGQGECYGVEQGGEGETGETGAGAYFENA